MNESNLYCKRCGHKWIPKKSIITKCPCCESIQWNYDSIIVKENPKDERIIKIILKHDAIKRRVLLQNTKKISARELDEILTRLIRLKIIDVINVGYGKGGKIYKYIGD